MGCDVHITRKLEWSDEDGPYITLEEWLDYVESDPEMTAETAAEADTPWGGLRMESDGLAVWAGSGIQVWFHHSRDRVTVKNPNQQVLEKMHQIAVHFEAHVLGDEGEVYGPDGQCELEGQSADLVSDAPFEAAGYARTSAMPR